MSSFYRRLFSFTFACLLAAALAAPARAQDTNQAAATARPAKPAPKKAKEAKELKFSGKLGAMDKVQMTITLDEKAKRVFEITSDTLITKDGKPAIMADGAVGDAIRGTYRKTDDGKLEALILNYGEKSEPAKPAKKTKKTKKTLDGGTNAVSTNGPAI